MKEFLLFLLPALLVGAALFGTWLLLPPKLPHHDVVACNVADPNEIENGPITRFAEAAVTLGRCLVKQGTADNEVDICGAADRPIGIAEAEAEIDATVTVLTLGGHPVGKRMIASEEIVTDAPVYTAAAGKLQNEPAVAGTYFRVGVARTAAADDGDEIIVETHPPVKVVVIAAMTGTATDDIAAIAAALTEPAELKILEA